MEQPNQTGDGGQPPEQLFDARRTRRYIEAFFKWGIFALLTGGIVGTIGALFGLSVVRCDEIFQSEPRLVWFLPLGGLGVAGLYALCGQKRDAGTNGILNAVRTNERIPPMTPPLIFLATCLTHIFGGSTGKEGAALQLGGGISHTVGRWMRLDGKDTRIMTMCGMSAAFSAVFCTPLTAALFAMEITSIGVMYYAALLPCAVSSLTAFLIARALGVNQHIFALSAPQFSALPALQTVLLASACALLSILFCIVIHKSAGFAARRIKNHYLRAAAGGAIVIALTCLVRSTDYNGSGMNLVSAAMAGNAVPAAFALKLLFTAVCIGAGFKGGEMVPLFAVGAAFGCACGGLIGLDVRLAAAIGLICLFCGATNCPMSALLLSTELFVHGSDGSMLYFLLAVAVSYLLSGTFGLYHEQKLVYSKLKTEFIDMKVH